MSDDKETRQHFSAEASTGLSFANVLLGIGLAITGLVVTSPPTTGLLKVAAYSMLISFAAFFGTLFFANVHGAIRLKNEKAYNRAMLWGNAFTEYFGVYILCIIFPIFVFSYTQELFAARMALAIVVIGFLVYQLSNFDLLSRWTKKLNHTFITVFFAFAMIIDFEMFIRVDEQVSLLISLAVIFFCLSLVILDIRFMTPKMNNTEHTTVQK